MSLVLCGLIIYVLTWVDWLNRCKIGHSGGWYARYCELTVYLSKKKLFLVLASYSRAVVTLVGCLCSTVPSRWWAAGYQMPGTKGEQGFS